MTDAGDLLPDFRGWTKEKQQAILERLRERGAPRPCPRCGGEHFNLLPGFAVFGLVPQLNADHADRHVASVGIVCGQCGYLSFHDLGALGLMPDDA